MIKAERLQLCWETCMEVEGFLQGNSHQIMGTRSRVLHQKAALPARAFSSSFCPDVNIISSVRFTDSGGLGPSS